HRVGEAERVRRWPGPARAGLPARHAELHPPGRAWAHAVRCGALAGGKRPAAVARHLQLAGGLRPMRSFEHVEELEALVGQTVGHSDWVTITQEQVTRFAQATGDEQWIHVDVERARQGPF